MQLLIKRCDSDSECLHIRTVVNISDDAVSIVKYSSRWYCTL